jgi:SAM-dependent methyltransferase
MPENRPSLFSWRSLAQARIRANRLSGDRFLDRSAAEGIADRLSVVKRRFAKGMMLDVPERLINSLEKYAEDWTFATLGEWESIPLENQQFDLVISAMALHAVNDLPGALIQIRRALKPDGLFLGALLGGATLAELRDSFAYAESEILGGLSPRVSPFADVRDLGALLQRADFALPVADIERISVRYGDFFGLVRDLRAHGFTNTMAERSRKFLRRDMLAAMLDHYGRRHGEAGKLKVTFEIVYLTGWAPHESQQQPLKPGSAKTRLADALGVKEHKP